MASIIGRLDTGKERGMMFSNFTSSDEHERDRAAFKRLCALRAARAAGYFNEPIEPLGKWPDEPINCPEHPVILADYPKTGSCADYGRAYNEPILVGDNVSDGEFDEWLAQQPELGKMIDYLRSINQWDYESDEGFRGRKV